MQHVPRALHDTVCKKRWTLGGDLHHLNRLTWVVERTRERTTEQ